VNWCGEWEGPDGVLIKPTYKPSQSLQELLLIKGYSIDQIERWRQAEVIPPDEFDHEYAGTMVITRVDAEGIKTNCPSGKTKIGCALGYGTSCYVFIATDDILGLLPYELIYRHERAHCNGWHHT
jgi:hypothetical protein